MKLNLKRLNYRFGTLQDKKDTNRSHRRKNKHLNVGIIENQREPYLSTI